MTNGKPKNASVAQLVEQRIRNAQVVGSSPTTSFETCLKRGRFFISVVFSIIWNPAFAVNIPTQIP